MIAVLFELTPNDGRRQDYLDIAAALSDELHEIDGFISIERFESLIMPGKLLSLSFWRNEAAVATWRNRDAHRAAQIRGRRHILADYRLRVAEVVRDYGLSDRPGAPQDSRTAHEYSRTAHK